MKWIIGLLIIISITGCGSDPFEQSMRKGKDALKAANYEEAVKQFELALIEEPRNEDARILLDQSNEGFLNVETKNKLKTYQDDIRAPLGRFNTILDKYLNNEKEGILGTSFDLKILNSVLDDTKKINSTYSDFEGIIEINNKLITAVDSLISYLESDGALFAGTGHTRSKIYLVEYTKLINQY